MNRRSNERIQMKLPCVLSFSEEWGLAFTGVTANMHRDGLLVSCSPSELPRELPRVGDKCVVQVELPANHSFSPKCVVCETKLLRVNYCGETETQFAMKIESVAFRDLGDEAIHLASLKSHTSRLTV